MTWPYCSFQPAVVNVSAYLAIVLLPNDFVVWHNLVYVALIGLPHDTVVSTKCSEHYNGWLLVTKCQVIFFLGMVTFIVFLG